MKAQLRNLQKKMRGEAHNCSDAARVEKHSNEPQKRTTSNHRTHQVHQIAAPALSCCTCGRRGSEFSGAYRHKQSSQRCKVHPKPSACLSERLHGKLPAVEIYSCQLLDRLNGQVFCFEFLGACNGWWQVAALIAGICHAIFGLLKSQGKTGTANTVFQHVLSRQKPRCYFATVSRTTAVSITEDARKRDRPNAGGQFQQSS